MNSKRKRILHDVLKYPFYYKLCEACDAINSRDSAFCMYCGNYRFEESIVKISKTAQELLTQEEDPLNFLE